MMQEIATTTPAQFDGFDDHNSVRRGGDFVKFDASTPTKLSYRDGTPLPLGPYIAVDCGELLNRWQNRQLISQIRKTPGEPLPDVEAMNDKIPQD
jgi:hypothetical protein